MPVNEHILVLGFITLFHIITELSASDRCVIQHEISHKIVLIAKTVDIVPSAEIRIDDIIIYDSKTSVTGRREERENVQTAEFSAGEVFVEYMLQILQIFSDRIAIGDEHDFVFDFFHMTFLYV